MTQQDHVMEHFWKLQDSSLRSFRQLRGYKKWHPHRLLEDVWRELSSVVGENNHRRRLSPFPLALHHLHLPGICNSITGSNICNTPSSSSPIHQIQLHLQTPLVCTTSSSLGAPKNISAWIFLTITQAEDLLIMKAPVPPSEWHRLYHLFVFVALPFSASSGETHHQVWICMSFPSLSRIWDHIDITVRGGSPAQQKTRIGAPFNHFLELFCNCSAKLVSRHPVVSSICASPSEQNTKVSYDGLIFIWIKYQ